MHTLIQSVHIPTFSVASHHHYQGRQLHGPKRRCFKLSVLSSTHRYISRLLSTHRIRTQVTNSYECQNCKIRQFLTAELVTSIVLTPEMLCWFLYGLVFWIPRRWTPGGSTCRYYTLYVMWGFRQFCVHLLAILLFVRITHLVSKVKFYVCFIYVCINK